MHHKKRFVHDKSSDDESNLSKLTDISKLEIDASAIRKEQGHIIDILNKIDTTKSFDRHLLRNLMPKIPSKLAESKYKLTEAQKGKTI